MFKRDLSVYLVNSANEQYKLRVYNDVSFSQVYSDTEIPLKTLHNPENLISDGFTSDLRNGNFSFTIAILDTNVATALFNIIFKNEVETVDLYFEENSIIKKLSLCVFESATFNLQKDAIITLSVVGSFSSETTEVFIPGTPQVEVPVYTYIEGIGITLNSVAIENITGYSIEVSNSINWLDNNWMQDSAPKAKDEFIHGNKVISGNFSRNTDMNTPSYLDSVPLLVQIQSNSVIFLEFDFPSILSTSRQQLSEVISQGYDFRVTSNVGNEIRHKGVNIIL